MILDYQIFLLLNCNLNLHFTPPATRLEWHSQASLFQKLILPFKKTGREWHLFVDTFHF